MPAPRESQATSHDQEYRPVSELLIFTRPESHAFDFLGYCTSKPQGSDPGKFKFCNGMAMRDFLVCSV
jgi:hypothetical protein